MFRKSALTTAAALALVLTHGPTRVEANDFAALSGVETEVMNAQEMEATQGKMVPCVSEICGGAGGILSGSPFAGVEIAPSSAPFIISDVAAAYPWVWAPLFPGFPVGSGGLPGIDQGLAITLGNIDATLGIVGLGF